MIGWSDYNSDRRSGMIVGLAGFARSGKDTVGKILVDNHGFTRISFATPVYNGVYAMNPIITFKGAYSAGLSSSGLEVSFVPVRLQEIVNQIGWEKAKVDYPEIRRLLQAYGTEAGRDIHGENCWVNLACKAINSAPNTNFVVTDVRFENEVNALKRLGAVLVKITRPGITSVNNHVSDKELPDNLFNHFIRNNGDETNYLRILEERANELIREKGLLAYTSAGSLTNRSK